MFIADPEQRIVERAADALSRGEIVALPTETVYGLAGDADNPHAVKKIFALKGRPPDHPVIVHVSSIDQIEGWAKDISPVAIAAAERFWPGPLTLILKRQPHVSNLITGGQDTVGLRMPDHPLTLAILRRFGGGAAAPSANRFGRVSPTAPEHVREEFSAAEVPLIVAGGRCEIGLESTILDLSAAIPRILRPGMIDKLSLENVLQMQIQLHARDAPRVSGSLDAHYQPNTPAFLVPRAALRAEEQGVVALALRSLPPGMRGIALPEQARAYAKELYGALRELDRLGAQKILIEGPPRDDDWAAVWDRLLRATHHQP